MDNGICYKCLGRKYEEKEIRLYTEKERAALDRQVIRRAEKAEAKLEAEKAEKLAKSKENKKEWFEKNGFSAEGVTYAILLMNAFVWTIDRYTAPRRFGVKKGGKKA